MEEKLCVTCMHAGLCVYVCGYSVSWYCLLTLFSVVCRLVPESL